MANFDEYNKLLSAMAERSAEEKPITDLLFWRKNLQFPEKFRGAAQALERDMNRVLDAEGVDPKLRFTPDGKVVSPDGKTGSGQVDETKLIRMVQTLVGCTELKSGAVGPETIVKVREYVKRLDETDANRQRAEQACKPLESRVQELENREAARQSATLPPAPSEPKLPIEDPRAALQRKSDNFVGLVKPPAEGWAKYVTAAEIPSDFAQTRERVINAVAAIEAYPKGLTGDLNADERRKFVGDFIQKRAEITRSLGNSGAQGADWKSELRTLFLRGGAALEASLKTESTEPKMLAKDPELRGRITAIAAGPLKEIQDLQRTADNFAGAVKAPKGGWATYVGRRSQPDDIEKTIDRLAGAIARIEEFPKQPGEKITKEERREFETAVTARKKEILAAASAIGDTNKDGMLDSAGSWRQVLQALFERGAESLEKKIQKSGEPPVTLSNDPDLKREVEAIANPPGRFGFVRSVATPWKLFR